MTNEDLKQIAALLEPLQQDMKGLRQEVSSVKQDTAGLHQELADVKQDTAGLRQELGNINLTLENRVFPQLQALSEGQKIILETLAPKSRVENLEDEVAFLKQILKTLASDVNELKKAQ
jgi:archaellum component FlaC